ncbi:hypothetical protein [Streptomyces sp. enrichment culture]|uniref:hypothetical protein n=1 Tax=Streptomyces sp. enrichment culture TaxID=1795815 RepID=UPI003F542F99
MTGTGGTVPGDEVHEGEGAGSTFAPAGRGKTGPRHAAPRKPLLTRLHMPAGKAVALAAMPSAVLMGMGLTPQLANAKPLPKSPFKGESCVSISEQQETAQEKAERKKRAEKLKRDLAKAQAEREKAAEEARRGGKGDEAGADGSSTAPGHGDGADRPSGGDTSPAEPPAADEPPATPPSSTTPPSSGGDEDEEADGKNPWYDPLGLGKKLEDTFKPRKDAEDTGDSGNTEDTGETEGSEDTGDGKDAGKGEETDPSDADSAPSGGTQKSPSHRGSQDGERSGAPAKRKAKAQDRAGDSGQGDDEGDEAEDDERSGDGEDGKPGGKKDGEESGESGVDKKDGTVRDYDPAKDAGKPFPCPEKTHVAGTDEQTPAQVANDPWYLEASSLTLKGLDYKGVVNITTPDGRTKQALKFTASGLDIGDLHQIVKGDNGLTYHVEAAKGSTSTIRDGQVTLYTEELKGNLFGLIPITFTPETPPPINVPFAYFTHVTVKQAGQFGGTLTIPGLHQYVRKA